MPPSNARLRAGSISPDSMITALPRPPSAKAPRSMTGSPISLTAFRACSRASARDTFGDLGPNFRQPALEQLAVLGVPNRRDRRAQHLDAQPLEGPALRQREAAVERGLSAKAQQNAIALLPLQDPVDVVRRDRDEVNLVRKPFAGLDRGDIRVDQDSVDAFLAQRLDRLGSGVVELARLADLQRARAE